METKVEVGQINAKGMKVTLRALQKLQHKHHNFNIVCVWINFSRIATQLGSAIGVSIALTFDEARYKSLFLPSAFSGADGVTTIPQDAIDSVKKNKIGLKGPLATPIGKGHVSMNLTIRRTFGLYANVRPAKSLDGLAGVVTPYDNVDVVILRENTEGEYSGIEHIVS